MTSKMPKPGELEPIEKASRDEVAALQLQRLQWSLRHAYENVPHYRKKFDAATAALAERETLLAQKEEAWLELEILRENAG